MVSAIPLGPVHFAVAGSRKQAAMLSDGFQVTICSVVLKSVLVFGKKMGHHHGLQTSGYMGVMSSSFPAPPVAGLFLGKSAKRGVPRQRARH
jgi:hypothetical protein